MASTIDVRTYSDPHQYLRDAFVERRHHNPALNQSTWARHMGFRSHTVLSLILNGKRMIRPAHVPRLARGLKLEGTQLDYFSALVSFHNSASDLEKSRLARRMKRLANTNTQFILELEKFEAVSNWLHFAILEMTELRDFVPDHKWIAKRLGHGITAPQVRAAVARLTQLKLLEKRDGKWIKTNRSLFCGDGTASEAIRSYHRSVVGLGLESIDNQTVQERILNSFSFTIDPAELPKAEKLIAQFRKDLEALLSSDSGQETYQCNIQIFRLTQKKTERERQDESNQ